MKNKLLRFSFLWVCGLLTLVASLSAQPTMRRYATQSYMRLLADQDPELLPRRSAFERFTDTYMRDGQPDTVTIAVVFHLMQYPGVPMPTERDIAIQMARLEHDFFTPPPVMNAIGFEPESDYYNRAAEPHIRFCVPTESPQGFPTNGIVMASASQAVWSVTDQGMKNGKEGGSPAWDPEHYLNIWVAPLAAGVAGYAQMPGGDAATDGIVISPLYFARADSLTLRGMDAPNLGYKTYPYGKPEDGLGRTLVHLIGNYLNLYDLWNEESPCSDDYVWDTPIHNAPNMGQPYYKHVSVCAYNGEKAEDYPLEMTMNLMDNTDDVAQYMFTQGQVQRMHATLAAGGPRGGLRQTPSTCRPALTSGEWAEERKTDPEEEGNLSLSVFPNPAFSAFVVDIGTENRSAAPLDLQVFNTLGELVWREKRTGFEGSTQIRIDAASWPSGLYTVQAQHGDVRQITKMLLER